MATHKYIHAEWTFTDKEIGQIIDLLTEVKENYLGPIDRRKYSKTVCTYAEQVRLVSKRRDGRIIANPLINNQFHAEYDLPVEVLWRICKPMLKISTGFSVTKNKNWGKLDIVPQGDELATALDIERQAKVLTKLAEYGYISFKSAGNIWDIEILL